MLRCPLLFLAALASGWLAVEAEDPSLVYSRDIAETRSYSLGFPRSPKLTPDGSAVVFLRGGPRDTVLRLYTFDVASKTEAELVTPQQLLNGANEVLSPEERAHRERTRDALHGFTEFELSRDGSHVLAALSGKLFVVGRVDHKIAALPGDGWISPHFSPDGAYVAAVGQGELNVIDLATLTAHPITSGATQTLRHATAEFIAQEEMNRFDGFWWSPDSRFLAYQETDESRVEVRYIVDPLNPAAPPLRAAYPHAGAANAKVRLGVVARDGGPTQWVRWDNEKYPYMARVEWKEPGAPLTVLVEDRHQQNERLLAFDPSGGTSRELLSESDAAWLNLVEPGLPHWLKGATQFLWSTERRGAWQLELHDATGALVRALTPTGLGYRSLVGTDEAGGVVYVLGCDNPTETQLWRFPLAGGDGTQMTQAHGEHGATLSEDGHTLVHEFSLIDGTQGADVLGADGSQKARLPSVAETPRVMPGVELTRTTGDPSFYAAVLRPLAFTPGRKYPVILSAYGGPQTTYVTSNARAYFSDQWMADQGYIVVRLDGRGTTLRGHDWQRLMRGNFIDLALHDQVEGLKALGNAYPEMDMTRRPLGAAPHHPRTDRRQRLLPAQRRVERRALPRGKAL